MKLYGGLVRLAKEKSVFDSLSNDRWGEDAAEARAFAQVGVNIEMPFMLHQHMLNDSQPQTRTAGR